MRRPPRFTAWSRISTRNFDRLLTRLQELELGDDTIIVFVSDNGPQQQRYTAGLRGRKSNDLRRRASGR